ncbi:MAG: ATP-binding protein, partial [Sarcina sp.]
EGMILMTLEKTIQKIMEKTKNTSMTDMTSQNFTSKTLENQSKTLKQNIDCKICNGTRWIENENGYVPCKCVEIEKVKILWENFGVRSEDAKKIKDYKPYNDETLNAKKKAIDYVKKFNETYNATNDSFALCGQTGSGKTHIIVGIGRALLEKNIPVVYMPYLEAIRELKCNVLDEEYYLKLLRRYQRTKVLIIDDLFKDKVKKGKLLGQLSESDIKHIYPIINYRYLNKLPIIISTECTPEMLLDLDSAIGGRILECVNKYLVIFTKDSSYRIKKIRKFMSLNKC